MTFRQESEFGISLGTRDRLRVKIDATNSVVYVGYEAEINGDWHVVISYDNYHGKGNHGHRYHPNGIREPIRKHNIPKHLASGKFGQWARKTLMDEYWNERVRYESEMLAIGERVVEKRGGVLVSGVAIKIQEPDCSHVQYSRRGNLPPPQVKMNMLLSDLLFDAMEKDPTIAEKLAGRIVIHIVPGQDLLNDYNRWVAGLRQQEEGKPIVEVHWSDNVLDGPT